MRHLVRVVATASIALGTALVPAARAGAQTFGGNLTADNDFNAYLGTSPTVAGLFIGSGDSWSSTYSLAPQTLAPGQTYYLHVAAGNYGGPGGFLGTFTLTGTGHVFANGLTTLSTDADASHWSEFTTGFGVDQTSLMDEGANGVGPWGYRSGIAGDARWIWSTDNCGTCTRYFSTTIAPTTSVTPEPVSVLLLATGLAGLLPVARRRRD